MALERIVGRNSGLGRRVGTLVSSLLLVGSLSGCSLDDGDGSTKCDVNPIVELAREYDLPDSVVDEISVLGDDCIVDEHEYNLVVNLLPGILGRSNEVVALSYVDRFVGDDNRFDGVENLVMSRFFLGRYDREGLLVHPGYFELVDDGHVRIPNAYFMPIFELPFRFDPFPGGSGGKGLPIVEDNYLVGGYSAFDIGWARTGIRSPETSYTWLEEYSYLIVPEVDGCANEHNYASTQFGFRNYSDDFDLEYVELVNPFPVSARVSNIGFLVNANDVRNARVSLEPVYWPSSLGHTNVIVSMSHVDDVDIEETGLKVGDIIPVEGRFGMVERDFEMWMFIFSYRSDNGFYRPGDADRDSRFKTVDIFHPHFYEPEMRGRVWPAYYSRVDDGGVPLEEALGFHNSTCGFIIDGVPYMGSHPLVDPMILYYPDDIKIK
ncbi:MAG: hypothetical protein ACMXYL_04710 [Candidatus Woesearchaeota archaeon]